jgi:hypothetical protein
MNKIFKLASAFKMKCGSSPMKEVSGPGKKKPAAPAPTFDPAQRIGTGEGNIGGPGGSTGVYNFNRPRPVADNELMQTKDVSYNQSKKYAKAANAGVENEVRWNVERQAKMDSTNTANTAKFNGLSLAQQKKAGNMAANETRKNIGSPSHPQVDRITDGTDGYGPYAKAKNNDTYKRGGSFEVKYNYKDLAD